MDLVLNQATVNVSTQFYVLFDDEFSTVPFIRKGTIYPDWTDLVHHISQSGAPENMHIKDNWFTPDLEEDPIKTSRHKVSVVTTTDNKNNMLASYTPKICVHEDIGSEGPCASDSH